MSKESQEKNTGAATDLQYNEFPIPSYEEWRKAAEDALKGAPFEKRLITKTYEGIDVQPMYRQENLDGLPHIDTLPGFAPYVRGSRRLGYLQQPWDVSQEIGYATAEEFNRALIADMERGQTAVNLALDRATLLGEDADEAETKNVGLGGVSISSVQDLGKALSGVDLEQTPIYIQAGAEGLPVMALLVALLRHQDKSPEKLTGCIGMDPLGTLARTGVLARALPGDYDTMAELTAWAKANASYLQTISVQSHPYHDGGGSATQELGFAIAAAVEYLREMQARGLSVDDIAPRMRFFFSLGSNFFMEIAKLRAARLLWAKIVKAFGGDEEAQKMHSHVRTSAWNKTVYDPHVNMLRATTEAFSGVVSGCDSMHVAPFDEPVRQADDFSRRIARNIHIILREECGITRTVDPAGGSWYVESLTDSLSRKAWAIFQEVEKKGGMYRALQEGFPQSQVAEVASKRASNLALRRDIFVGTNMYANMSEKPLQVSDIDREAIKSRRTTELAQHRQSIDTDWRDGALGKLAESAKDKVVEAAIHAAEGGATLGELCRTLGAADQSTPVVEPVRIHRGAELFEGLRRATEGYAAKTGGAPKVFLANMGPIPQHKARADFSTGFLEVAGFEVMTNKGFPEPDSAAKAAIESEAPIVVICSSDPTYPDIVPSLTKQIKDARPDTTVLLAGYPADHVEAFKEAGVDDFIHLRANCYELLLNLQKKSGVQS